MTATDRGNMPFQFPWFVLCSSAFFLSRQRPRPRVMSAFAVAKRTYSVPVRNAAIDPFRTSAGLTPDPFQCASLSLYDALS
jgi:hypothetical protein